MPQPNLIKRQTFYVSVSPRANALPAEPVPGLPHTMTVDTPDYVVHLCHNDPALVRASADGNRVLLLIGDIFDPQDTSSHHAALRAYEQQGPAFIRSLNGRFALILVDKAANRVLVGTDRMASCTILHTQAGASHLFTNSGYLLPVTAADVDPVAVGCYLASGVHYNDLTFFKHVKVFDAATLFQFHDGRLERNVYWNYRFTGSLAGTPEAEIRAEYGQRLIRAVQRRYDPSRPTYLSLSGGVDSRGILGILHRYAGATDVQCFSYTAGDVRPEYDESRARELAAVCGYPHELIASFRGNVVHTLVRNAVLGQGLNGVCDEVDAWDTLAERVSGGPRPVMFEGDHPILPPGNRISTDADISAQVKMVDIRMLAWLEPLVGPETFGTWLAGTREQVERGLRLVADHPTIIERAEVLWYLQRHRRRRIPWREQFAENAFDVMTPLVDNELLDYLLMLPRSLRANKQGFKDALREIVPHVFSVPMTHRSGYYTYWKGAFQQQKAEAADFIQSYASPLDNLIAPDVLLKVLEQQSMPGLNRDSWAWRLSQKVYRQLRRAKLIPPVASTRTSRPVDPVAFLERALVARHYLALATGTIS